MTTLIVPALLRDRTGGAQQVQVRLSPGERITIHRVLERLEADHPGLLEGLLYRGDLMPGFAVFVNDEQASLGLQAKVEDSDTINIVPAVVGGR